MNLQRDVLGINGGLVWLWAEDPGIDDAAWGAQEKSAATINAGSLFASDSKTSREYRTDVHINHLFNGSGATSEAWLEKILE
jgi:hypothetical protein